MIALILSYCFSSNSSLLIISIFIEKIVRQIRRIGRPGLQERELLASASNLCCRFLPVSTGWRWLVESIPSVKDESSVFVSCWCDKYPWLCQRSGGNNTEVMIPGEWKHTVTISLMRLNVPSVSELRGIFISLKTEETLSFSRNKSYTF